MKHATAIAIISLLTLPLACTGATDTEDEAFAQGRDPGKADGYSYEIVHTTYTNKHETYPGELIRLTLREADDLPAAHYEGRYELTERVHEGERSSAGFYNVYKYRDRLWIRFLDEATGDYETTYEKYGWLYWDGTLVMQGHGSDSEFFMEPPLSGTQVNCTAVDVLDDNVFEEGLSVHEYPDVSIVRNPSRDELDVDIGAHSYEVSDGDDIAFAIEGNVATATITKSHGDTIVVTGPANGSGPGNIYVTEDGAESHVATMTCRGETASDGPVTYECDRYGASPFGVDVSDALRRTPAELRLELSPANLGDADSTDLEQLALVVDREEATDLDRFLASIDEQTVRIYDVTYGQVAYTWLQYFFHSTEAGFIFAEGTDWLDGQVGDGDIRGCDGHAECSYDFPSPVSETTAGLLGPGRATEVATLTAESDMSDTVEAQLRAGMGILFEEDTASMPLAEVMDFADEDSVYLYTIDDGQFDWYYFYAGDTEVGIMFTAGTLVPVASVGDGDISRCGVAD